MNPASQHWDYIKYFIILYVIAIKNMLLVNYFTILKATRGQLICTMLKIHCFIA